MAEPTPPEETVAEPDELLKAELEIVNVKNAELQASLAAAEAERDELRKAIRDNPALNEKLTQELRIVNSQIQTKNDELDNIPVTLDKDEQDLIRQKRQDEIGELVARKQKITTYLQEA
ncbi:hypothetical protein [Methanococcoides sp. AM1]|uniref:hypothetical protein n=1 Tax=Methanococcoides sp. AM1 TaxID=1201011 RepID=UPI001082AF46|nr:hypothetical protein [Methanococcoides sp. AM1]